MVELLLAVPVLLLAVVVVVGVPVFLVWVIQYFVLRAYRHGTRRHLYVPVQARATRADYHTRLRATLHVEYALGGEKIVNRFLTTHDVARLAESSGSIALRADPDYPYDVVVDPAFEARAAACPRPPDWERAAQAGALRHLVRVLLCVVFGAAWLWWPQQEAMLGALGLLLVCYLVVDVALLMFPSSGAPSRGAPDLSQAQARPQAPPRKCASATSEEHLKQQSPPPV